ncbi:MAG: hypothetical protein SFZ23_05710 [Planctomycetota bacterium]|nr:hypothetical protein [Planctomycetota bacterium]
MDAEAGKVLEHVASEARAAGVFANVELVRDRGLVQCQAAASAAPAWYRVQATGEGVFVSVVTPDRWLSHSVEADLLHTGDKLEELLEEELAELGLPGTRPAVDHYRDDEKLFTFRSRAPKTAREAALFLLAYEACFRNLGDMHQDEDE